MKKLLAFVLGFALLPAFASAQQTVPAGGTGLTGVPTNSFLAGFDTLHLRATSSPFFSLFSFGTATGTSATTTNLFSTNASTTNLFGTNITGFGLTTCNSASSALTWSAGLFGCHTISAGSSASTTLLGDNNTFSGANTFTQNITGSITGNAGTATKLATGHTISVSGDLTYTSPSFDGSGDVTAVGTLATVNITDGSFGSANSIPHFTVNGKGLITTAGANTPSIPASEITTGTFGTGDYVFPAKVTATNASSTLFSTSYASSTQYFGAGLVACNSASNAVTWSAGVFGCNTISAGSSASSTLLGDNNTFSGNDTFTNAITGSVTGNAGTATKLATARTIAITGDLTYTSPSFDGTGNVTAAGTLATVNSNVGSFTNANITVNGKGLVTAAANGTDNTASSTLLGDNNAFTGLDTFTDLKLVTRSTTTNATTTNLAISNIASGNCLQTTTGGAIIGSGSACGSGGGGSSGGTFSTTTSNVSGELINYSNNSTDIVAVGGTATTSAKFFVDPNLNNGTASTSIFLAGNGSKAAPSYSFSTKQNTGIRYVANNSLAAVSDGIDVLGFSNDGFNGYAYSGSDIFGASAIQGYAYDPSKPNFSFIDSQRDTGMYQLYSRGGIGLSVVGTQTFRTDVASTSISVGNFGVGTTSPFSKLSIAGNSYLGGNVTATGTLSLLPLATSAGSFLAVDPTGAVIATTTPAGGSGVTSITAGTGLTGGTITTTGTIALDLTAQNIFTGASTTFVGGVTLGTATATSATTTNLAISSVASKLLTTNGNGTVSGYGGASACSSNNFVTALSALGATTCGTSTISGISLGGTLGALTATDATLTFSGSYTGATARTVGLNLGNANTWTALQTFSNANSLLATGSSTLQNFTFVNATGTQATTSSFAISGISSGNCLHTTTGGAIVGTGSDCGSGSATSPGGATGNIQLNDFGVFGGHSYLTLSTTSANAKLTIGAPVTAQDIGQLALSYSGSVNDSTLTIQPANGTSGAKTITIPNLTDTLAVIGTNNSFTAQQSFTNANSLLASGSSTLQAFTFTNATGSAYQLTGTNNVPVLGIYSPAVNQMAFSTASIFRGLFDANGRFALGTSTPTFDLTVASTSPTLELDDTDGATNQKHLLMSYNSGLFAIGTSSDSTLTSTSTDLTLNPASTLSLGIGTSSPWATFSLVSSSSPVFVIASSTTPGSTNPLEQIDPNSHHTFNGPKPTCGTGCASIVGNDNGGVITTSSAATAVTLTFANTWTATPVCTISDNSTAITGDISALSTTAFTASFSVGITGLVYYQCAQYGS